MKARSKGGGGGRPGRPVLACERDGVSLPDDEARRMWEAFSAFMDAEAPEGPGAMEAAMDRFARTVGMISARPGLRKGSPLLVLRSR